MTDWRENAKGNFYAIDCGEIVTVFRLEDGDWGIAHDGGYSLQHFDTAEEAMEAVEDHMDGTSRLKFNRPDNGWKRSKKGGSYRHTSQGIASVKEARSGSWFVSIGGKLVEGEWFDTREDAQAYVARIC